MTHQTEKKVTVDRYNLTHQTEITSYRGWVQLDTSNKYVTQKTVTT